MLSRFRNRFGFWLPSRPPFRRANLALYQCATTTPSTTPGSNDAIAWFGGVFEDALGGRHPGDRCHCCSSSARSA